MNLCQHLKTLSAYNLWINNKIYTAAAQLPASELEADRRAFFGSIVGTLNHIAVGDRLWLKRFAAYPPFAGTLQPLSVLPTPALSEVLFADLSELTEHRRWLDGIISEWVEQIREEDLGQVLDYRSSKGVPARKLMGSLILNLFNHQTHHRGQVTTLLSQAGIDLGVTDMVVLLPEQE